MHQRDTSMTKPSSFIKSNLTKLAYVEQLKEGDPSVIDLRCPTQIIEEERARLMNILEGVIFFSCFSFFLTNKVNAQNAAYKAQIDTMKQERDKRISNIQLFDEVRLFFKKT